MRLRSTDPSSFFFRSNPDTVFLFRLDGVIEQTMESSSGATDCNWSEAVEDLVHAGEIDEAISLLQSIVSSFEKEKQNSDGENSTSHIDDQLSIAYLDLSKLYSSKGLSLIADEVLSRSLQIKHKKGDLQIGKESTSERYLESHSLQSEASTPVGISEHDLKDDGLPEESCGDDWEAIADHTPDELLSSKCLPEVLKLSLEESTLQRTKQRGRGTFSYKKGLYSDYESDPPVTDDSEDNSHSTEDNDKDINNGVEMRNLEYGTRHVLVLADFPPSTRTTDLEKVLEKFKDRVVIRWVNDTVALAVFKTPSIALEASTSIQFPYTKRILSEDDELLSLIPPKDLEPPRQRPRTSARTAQRLIAQGMGIKLPSSFGSTEYRKQEDARKNRIVTRQNLRDDAWGDDGN